MPRTWFTSDTHFGHANIIRHCCRPFPDADAMDAALAANWNAVVAPGDTVWHLGDFTYRGAKDAGAYLQRLHGTKHLVWGNHDNAATRAHPGWASSQAMAEISVDGQRLVLLHYALRVWPHSHHGAIHLFGHSHNNLVGDSQSCDVGVDVPAFAFRPASLEAIREHLHTQPPRVPPDHHGRPGGAL